MLDASGAKSIVEGNTEWSGAIWDTSSSYLKGISDDRRKDFRSLVCKISSLLEIWSEW